ncbi:MAG: ParB/Srx family N-terminal domain-containing protein, partial [Bdellovibrionota bacterium]
MGLITAFLCASLSVSTVWSDSSIARVKLDQVRPTQTSLGHALVDRIYRDLLSKSGGDPSATMKMILSKNDLDPVPGVRGPDGAIYITDGHHRTRALALAVDEAELADSPEMSVKILEDYRGKTQEEFARDFLEVRKSGYFQPELRGLEPSERMRALP